MRKRVGPHGGGEERHFLKQKLCSERQQVGRENGDHLFRSMEKSSAVPKGGRKDASAKGDTLRLRAYDKKVEGGSS